jgi:hypothetical protein
MLHLLRDAINPALPLAACLRAWPEIAYQLREPRRRRLLQVDHLRTNPILD